MVAQEPVALPSLLATKVDSVFSAFDRPGSPGCAVGVFRAGAIAYARGYGMASLEHRIPITTRSVFETASASKMFTAAAVALLAQDGMLTLDDDIHRYVPELPTYGRPIRIRHLLYHTSGLREVFTLWRFAKGPISTNEQGLRLLARQQELDFDPGERFRYTNSGYLLLAMIVERVSGESLREYLARHFFAPLEMEATHVHDDSTMVMEARATPYAPTPDGGYRIVVDLYSEVISGPSGLNTTIEDLARWDGDFYSGTVGGDALWKEVSRPGKLDDGSTVPYGLGMELDEYRGLRRMHHGGTWGGWRAHFMRFPDQRLAIAVLCNLAGDTFPLLLAQEVADILLDGTFRAPPADSAAGSSVAVTEEALRSKVGVYYDSETGEIRRVSLRDGKLILHAFGEEVELRPAADNEFDAWGGWLRIVFDSLAESGGRRLNITTGSWPAQTFLSVESTTLGTHEMRDFEGEFHSEEVGVSYQLVVVDGQLLLRERNGTEKQLAPAFEDAFTVENMSIRFGRDAEGNVVGFRLSASRLWNLRFDRVVPANENHP
jgi:CubicO group peptidase (beta-lactamase class C family)